MRTQTLHDSLLTVLITVLQFCRRTFLQYGTYHTYGRGREEEQNKVRFLMMIQKASSLFSHVFFCL